MSEEPNHEGQPTPVSPTGRNFAAGMTGGIGYVVDDSGTFPQNCNRELVQLERVVDTADAGELKRLINQHRDNTGSTLADQWLAELPDSLDATTKVMPTGLAAFRCPIDA